MVFVLSALDEIGNILGHFLSKKRLHLTKIMIKQKLPGVLLQGEEYPSCPHCGAKGFFYCSCGKLNCWNSESRIATCNWCGATGELSDGIESINITGNI